MKADRRKSPAWYVLLALPFAGLLAPVYLRAEPSLFGFPFFYWYQLAWVPVSAALTWTFYRIMRDDAA